MLWRKILSLRVGMAFILTSLIPPAYAQTVFNLPQPGTMVDLSGPFAPAVLKGVSIHPADPLLFDFIVDNGQSGLQGQALTDETTKLVKYFLAGLAVPEKDLWVNLSPKEKDRVMADDLSHTDVGGAMLAQDYILKQVTASLMYPEKDLGRKFWDEIYKRAYAQFGNTNIPVDTFNKVWIMPAQATVYQNGNNAFVGLAQLKVMLESDFEAAKGVVSQQADADIELAKDVVRSVILPVLEKEVNEGRNFVPLRQVFHSMILAGWYKNALKESLLGQVYANTNKVSGIEIPEKDAREKVYAQYMEAYQKGVYNYVKEEFDRNTNETVPHKYFSGGITELNVDPGKGQASDVKVSGTTAALSYRMETDTGMDDAQAVLPRINPATTRAWAVLKTLADPKKYDLRSLFAKDEARAKRLSLSLTPQVQVDLSDNLVTDEVLKTLIELAYETELPTAIEQMFDGEKINETENRAVLHVALRNVKRDASGQLVAADGPMFVDGKDVMPEVITVLEKMEAFTKKVQSGEWKGFSGKKIKNMINVGIGGSDLGPKMAAEALKPFKAGDMEVFFLSNIDGTAAAELMKKLDPEETLVNVVSKTFTTQETMQNAQTLKDWILKAYDGNPEVVKKHFVASSTAKERVEQFGIDTNNMFEFWDWVGGRFSVWSAVGLTLATYIGFDNFLEFLQGAHKVDMDFKTKPFLQNIPVLKGLLEFGTGTSWGPGVARSCRMTSTLDYSRRSHSNFLWKAWASVLTATVSRSITTQGLWCGVLREQTGSIRSTN